MSARATFAKAELDRPSVRVALGFLGLLALFGALSPWLGGKLGLLASAARGTLLATAGVLGLALAIGLLLGTLAGVGPPLFDALLARSVELTGALPSIVLLALLRTAQPISPALGFVLALGVLRGVEMARLVRGEMLRVSGQEFVLAARALGASGLERVRAHILPHTLSPLLVSAAFCAAMVVGLDTALGLLGLGSTATFGELVGHAIQGSRPGAAVAPALAAALTTAATYLVAEALDDAQSERRRVFRGAAKGLPTSHGLPR